MIIASLNRAINTGSTFRGVQVRHHGSKDNCAPQKVDPALIMRFKPAMVGCFLPVDPTAPPASQKYGETRSPHLFALESRGRCWMVRWCRTFACAPQKVDPALIACFRPGMIGCFWPVFFFADHVPGRVTLRRRFGFPVRAGKHRPETGCHAPWAKTWIQILGKDGHKGGPGRTCTVLPPSSVATPRLNASVSWPACVGERHK